ncbi:putative membrane protein [Crossiella equi]|uniref:Membrane protein n=1 Tax=Crossiella equi TaxID=130796 RepID=A0ABS5AG85_9PSEU|nr:glycosyltransferase 87 family protein [Crossiella equi]MBP2475591.1 putative membrane protein [Crossiella equi]
MIRFGRTALAALVLLCGVLLVGAYANKARCGGPEFDQWGRSAPDYANRHGELCYSDIQHLWLGREVDRHVFPYLGGGLSEDGQLTGGSVEYPVLTGLFIWAGAVLATNDAEFLLHSSLLLAPFGLLVAWLLGRLSRWRALVWALAPGLVLHAFHNWDLPAVACAVGAVYAVHRGWGREGVTRPLVERAMVAGVLLGLGAAFKLYPGFFVLPLALYVLTGGERGRWLPRGRRWDVAGSVRVLLATAVTVALVNLPFAVLGYQGWLASFVFQRERKVDITTNSVWFWAFRPISDPSNVDFQTLVSWLSPTMVVLAFVIALLVGWLRWTVTGEYPWVGVSAAMLCGFLLLHKVHSPQYTLWLLPFFVLLEVRWGWVLAYTAVDLCLGIGVFLWYHAIEFGLPIGIYDSLPAQAVMIGVWGKAGLLLSLFLVFPAAADTFERRMDQVLAR